MTLSREGEYRIVPTDSLGMFELRYTDSGAIYGTAANSTGSVTFTNSFSKGDYAYRYIHEYYVKHPDGTYTHEGNSLITTVRGRQRVGEVYQAGDITKAVDYEGREYVHFDESYGWVTPLSPESSVNVKEDTNARTPEGSAPFISKYKGILPNGKGIANTDTGTREIEYAPVADWKETRVTTDAREIVILRYYRDEYPEGNYKVIHEYYLRDDTGDHWEGTTGIEDRKGELGIKYTAEKHVDKKPDFKPANVAYMYTYSWDGRAQYGEVIPATDNPGKDEYTGQDKIYQISSGWKSAEGTEAGNQIIVLRYYRGSQTGTYKIVHEYYLQEQIEEDQGGSEESSENEGNQETEIQMAAESASVADVSDNNSADVSGNNINGRDVSSNDVSAWNTIDEDISGNDVVVGDVSGNDVNGEDVSGEDMEEGETSENEIDTVMSLGKAEEPSSFAGTLNSDEHYAYTFEGAREIESRSGTLGTAYYAGESDWKTEYNGIQYVHYKLDVYGLSRENGSYSYNPDKTGAISTEEGNEVIILRYYHGSGDTPAPGPTPPDPGKDPGPDPTPNPPGDPDPPDDPKPPEELEIPPEEPEIPPENPGYPTELPDPNDPDSPDRITIWEEGVPKTYVKVWDPDAEQFIYILDEEVPMWGVAGTGDENNMALWLILGAGSMCALGMLGWSERRRKEKE